MPRPWGLGVDDATMRLKTIAPGSPAEECSSTLRLCVGMVLFDVEGTAVRAPPDAVAAAEGCGSVSVRFRHPPHSTGHAAEGEGARAGCGRGEGADGAPEPPSGAEQGPQPADAGASAAAGGGLVVTLQRLAFESCVPWGFRLHSESLEMEPPAK
eukprot:gene51786-32747_t